MASSTRLTSCLLLLITASAAAQPLPRLAASTGDVTVSGISSGGYMAVQFQVAHSNRVRGAGIVAGSQPEAELAETTAKLGTMLGAMGWAHAAETGGAEGRA